MSCIFCVLILEFLFSVYQQLVEQEMDEENRLAVQAIKYLGGAGFFSKHASSSAA
jgi:hypothetical protein